MAMGQIPQRFIDDLLARVDVVEVVGERVTLKKNGRNHAGLCPFHQEKSPSFTVSQDKQFYHCFGCGAHGNALRFLMEYDNLRFPEAVEQLAGSARGWRCLGRVPTILVLRLGSRSARKASIFWSWRRVSSVSG